MTATTEPGAPTGPPPGWAGPEPSRSPFERLRDWRPWAPPALVGGLVGLATAYTAWQDPTKGGAFFPGCPLRETTGLDCPGCGGTRAVHALTQGDIGAALDHNAVFTVVLPLLVVAWGLWLVRSVRTGRAQRLDEPAPPWPSYLRMPRFGQRGWLTVVAVLIAFAVVRNISAVGFLDYLNSEA